MIRTKEEWAALINGRQIGNEVSTEEQQRAKADDIVIVFGASDDLCEFRGAIYDEAGAYDSTTIRLDKKGILPERDQVDDDDELKDLFARQPKASSIEAVFSPKDVNASWIYKTTIPHARFDIMEEGNLYCRGIVFHIDDLPA